MRSARLGFGAGLVALAFAQAACGSDDTTTGPQPTGVSIAPSNDAPASTPAAPASSPEPTPSSGPSTAPGERVTTLVDAVAVAEDAVPDSTAVQASKDDDGGVVWEVTVRAGENGRELRIAGADGSVLSNESDQLHESQLGAEPNVSIQDAVGIAAKQVGNGAATDAELSRENGQRIWEVSVAASGGDEWELWIDASSGKVLRQERD